MLISNENVQTFSDKCWKIISFYHSRLLLRTIGTDVYI